MKNLKTLKEEFKHQLSDLYSDSEIQWLFEVFTEELLNLNKIQLRQSELQLLDINMQSRFYNLLLKLKQGKPYQQILGKSQFFGHTFLVDDNVLIPRPETEELLELAINKINTSDFKNEKIKILDIGTGSGVIAIILKKNFPNAEIIGLDVSEKALEMAKKNAELNGVTLDFIMANVLNEAIYGTFDVIISNPPYISESEMDDIADSVKNFEPKIALFSPKEDPLIFYRKIAELAENQLVKNGFVFLEINQKYGLETLDLFKNYTEANLMEDLSGNTRFVWVRK